MSDIHALNANVNDSGVGSVPLVLHVPISVANYPVDENRTSELPGISQAELDEIKAGTLYEKVVQMPVNFNSMTQPELVVAARVLYSEQSTKIINNLTWSYKYYLSAINEA